MNFKKFLFLNLCLESFLLGSFSFLRLRLLRKLSCHNFFLKKKGIILEVDSCHQVTNQVN